MKRLKAGLIADSHYCSQEKIGNRYPRRSLEKVIDAAAAFKAEKVDLILCMGDIINDEPGRNEENLQTICLPLVRCGVECFFVQGNHDRELFTSDELARISGMTAAPYSVVRGGVRLILLDGNFKCDGTPYRIRDIDWTDTFLPPDQIEMLRDSLARNREDAYIFVHQCLDPNAETHHIIGNAAQVRSVIASSGKVKGVWQGHYHPGLESTVDGIGYHTLPALCENGTWYIAEL